ncbi:MAG TPA: MFS transporter [Burkholderiaceae bacterium]|nr:MFS transporter [Burkholderiaceae bacterium]
MNPSSSSPTSSIRHDAEVIGLVGLAHGTSHFFHLMLPPLFPWLMKDFDLSYTEAGLLMTTFFVISGVGQALAGFVVDKTGSRPALFFGIGLLALSGVILGLSNSYAMLMVTAAIAGLGNSIFHPADFTLLNHRVAQPRLGHAFSMHGLSGNLGWAAAPVFMAGIATFAGWQAAGFAAAGVGAIVLAILFWRRSMLANAAAELVVPSHAQTAAEKPAANQFAFLRSTPVWLCFAFFFFATASFGILQNFAPAILGNVYGMSLVLATSTLTAYLLGSAAGTITGGFLASRNERSERLIAIALAFSASMALLLASGQIAAALVFPVMALMGFGVGTSGPNRDLLVRRAATGQFGKAAFGRIYGFVYSGLDVGLALSPLVFGPLLDAGRFQAALVAVAILLVAALLMAMRIASATRSAAVTA